MMIKNRKSDAGLLFDIQSYSIHDGPGCRTTIFLAGCYLKCLWCANPESWQPREKIMFTRSKCRNKNGCLRCIDACEKQGILLNEQKEVQLNWEKCSQCNDFKCTTACYFDALKICGQRYTEDELMHIINRDRNFWGNGGGVTFSGGEPFYQKEFLYSMLKRCKETYINTAIETTAYTASEDFLLIMPFVDFAFIDIKHMDSLMHKQYTGVGNEEILNNINLLLKSGWAGRLVLRMPVIDGFNDNIENINAVADFMDKMDLYEINILPFHSLGASKWNQLGKKYKYAGYTATPEEKMSEIQDVFLKRKIACYVGNEFA